MNSDRTDISRWSQEGRQPSRTADAAPDPVEMQPGHTGSSAEAAVRQFIETLAERKIKGFWGTIDEAGNYYSEVYAGNVSLAESITADYQGRFLIELIQNAYDVHPQGRADGVKHPMGK